jgi:neutral ceramidase
VKKTWLAGAAKREITPAVGTALTGFVARLKPCVGAADPMHVRAIVVAEGDERAALIQADLVGLASWQVTEVREFAAQRFGIPWERCMISCTHTHSGPGVVLVRGCGMADYAYQRFVVAQVQEAINDAASVLSPASLSLGATPYRLGLNRRQEGPDGVVLGVAPGKPCPDSLRLACLTTESQEAWLFTHACHPYVLGGDSLWASGDFPSFACRNLERDSRTVALFLNGCAGNIAPECAFQGLEAAQREGARMANALSELRPTLKPASDKGGVGGRRRVLSLPYQPLPTEVEVDALLGEQERTVRAEEREQMEIQRRVRAALEDWAHLLKRTVRLEIPLDPVHCEVQAFCIPGLTLVGISGEPFYEIGERIRAAALAGNEVWALGYTNAYCGYIPTRVEFPLGGYEVNDSWKFVGLWRIDDSAEERIVAAAGALLCES